MNVDIEVYLSGMIKFFKDNPKDLFSLIPKDKETDFYSMLRKFSCDNYDKGDDTDEWALENGYVAVVPVHYDFTAHHAFQHLNKIKWDD